MRTTASCRIKGWVQMFVIVLIAVLWAIALLVLIGSAGWTCVQAMLEDGLGIEDSKSRKWAVAIVIGLEAMAVVIAAIIAKGC